MVLKKEITFQIKDILKKNPQGMSITEIVKTVGINRNTAGRYLENLLVSGQVEMRRFGMAKIYMLSQRVPLSAVLSISSELVIQLDNNLRIIFTNEPFLDLIGADEKDLLGKNIEYTSVAIVFEDIFSFFLGKIRGGLNGKEWSGEVALSAKDILFSCHIAPTVFEDGRKGASVILEDITSRKKAEQKVEESERQFRLLAENSLDMIGRITPDYTHSYVSPAYTTSLGYLPEEIIGKGWEIFIHPEDVHSMEAIGKALTPQNSSATFRGRAKHKDGHYIWIESRVKAIVDEKTQKLSEYYAVTRDITESKRTEEALLESEKRLRLILDSTDDLVIMQDPEGRYLYFNSANQYGVSMEEMIGLTPYDFLDRVSAELLVDRVKNVTKTGQGIRTETPIVWKGQILWFSDSLSPVKDVNGTTTAVVTVSQNITERKRAEMALLESEATARALINAPTDSVILLDRRGILLALNETAAGRFGRRIDEVVGTLVDDLLPEEVARSRRSLIFEALVARKMVRFEDERDGRWYDTVAYPILSETGEVTRIAVIARDITDRKKAEDALRESEERYRQLVDISPDAVLIHKEGKIIFINPATLNLLGASHSAEIIGKKVLDFIQPEFRDAVMKNIEKDLGGEITSPMELRMLRVDGISVIAEGRGVRIFIDGKPAIMVAIRERH